MSQLTKLDRYSSIPLMLITGTFSIVISKVMYEMKSRGKKFEKPWFQTDLMFAGMILCLGYYWLKKHLQSTRFCNKYETLEKSNAKPAKEFHLTIRQFLKILPPAICDLVSTGMMMIGLLFIPASVFQLMRGSIILFTAIIARIFLKRPLFPFHWVALLIVTIALVVVGVASISDGQSDSSTNNQVLGMFLVVLAQLIQGAQTVIEEFLLKDVCAPPAQVVGAEGFWGFTVCTFIFLPILYAFRDVDGFGEDTFDTFDMLAGNKTLIIICVVYLVAILIFNQTGMIITLQYSAVFRTILEGIRTLCIWISDIFIFYVIDPDFGECWTNWSYLQLVGFGILIFGTFMYNRVFELPFFFYPPKEVKL